MTVGVFDLFRIGIGPSSSHTVGPMRAARHLAQHLADVPAEAVRVILHGSLALTGTGHGTDRALVAGLNGADPETVDPAFVLDLDPTPERVRLAHGTDVRYRLEKQARGGPPGHPNAMRFEVTGHDGQILLARTYRSIGGGFLTEDGVPQAAEPVSLPLPFTTGEELVAHASGLGGIAAVAAANEHARRPEGDVTAGLRRIAQAMNDCVERGLRSEGELPGGLRVRRRAPALHQSLLTDRGGALEELEWVALWAMAVNEENAAGGRIVTAPTNGAAGVLPAVLRYAQRFEGIDEAGTEQMLLAAAAIGALIKRNASISGAEVGCQGEVGSAAAMAAAALAEALGGSPAQVANAAEIALEHHLGMTCDPIGGLVQIPCIERNALGAGKAIAAAKLALRSDGVHVVSLDNVIDAMRRTGHDMHENYKETARGGLAVSVPAC
ncbi:L-serine ammonia-lyase [Capillimicrobium parvum]|uniref:L-serine dehydratase n=1 Tax=Capillimicrobium parvum TaxID=2884022 RepID=A0A9E6Y046_9ACTN|nr:L-serine dehydratase 1 [Capillimicrobium parvum]